MNDACLLINLMASGGWGGGMVLVRFGCLCWSSQLTSFRTLFVMKHPHPLLVFILGPFLTLAELVQENIMHRGYVGTKLSKVSNLQV